MDLNMDRIYMHKSVFAKLVAQLSFARPLGDPGVLSVRPNEKLELRRVSIILQEFVKHLFENRFEQRQLGVTHLKNTETGDE